MAKKIESKQNVKEVRQKKLIDRLKKKEHWMKWGLIAALIIILLLLLFIGYATDWTTGLLKNKATTPIGTQLDSSKTAVEDTAGSGGGGNSGGGGSTTTNNGSGTTRTGTDSSRTATESRDTSSTTTNNTTTNNNTTTPVDNGTPLTDALLEIYNDLNVGDSINDFIARARSLGIDVTCTEALLIQECKFTAGDVVVSTKNLLNTGLVTSVLRGVL